VHLVGDEHVAGYAQKTQALVRGGQDPQKGLVECADSGRESRDFFRCRPATASSMRRFR
jgi:hypothetical protein